MLISEVGVKQDVVSVGRGWLALQVGSGELVAAEAIRGNVEGKVGDVNLEELRAVRMAIWFAAAVALGASLCHGEDRRRASGAGGA